ncbi:MAG TPA: hypothetical protein PLV68_14980, partial [Ilumatobacteraceae bacterium]|nr:hypothetical protein [Ilumatobacteraceae bacterium]
ATIFMAIPHTDDTPSMSDNAFIRTGLHLPQYRDGRRFDIEEADGTVTWRVDDREYVWDPPNWRIRGEHAGVDVDLVAQAVGPGTWAAGPFETAAENKAFGYDVPIGVTGTITADGRTFQLDDAHGSHERAGMGQGRDIVAEVDGAEVLVADLFHDDIHMIFGQHTGRSLNFGRIDAGSNSVSIMPLMDQGVMSVTTLERWHDPKSGLLLPVHWRVVMSNEGANCELDVRAEGRAYWHYTTKSGVMVMVWQLSRANGTLYLPDGTQREIKDALTASRWGRSLLVADETTDGPRFAVLDELAAKQ